jgi:hypothetical protein
MWSVSTMGAFSRVFDDDFLTAHETLGHGEVAPAAGEFGFGTGHIDGSDGAGLDLIPVVREQLPGAGDGLLADAKVFVEAGEIPIESNDAGDGRDDLLAEDEVGDPQVVLRDQDVSFVDGRLRTCRR